jgi:hypothetical protein
MMWELWVEYVISNPQVELGGSDPGAAGFNWPGLAKRCLA